MSSTELDNTADAGTQGAPEQLAKGGTLGKYRLDRVLGEGGMGVVWAAHDPDLERAVALKVLRYAQASTLLRQRLLREARAMAKLKHPNVLTVYEVGTVGNRDYIAMELVDGTSLDRWFSAEPPQEEVWSAILAAGRGLAAAHDAGVVHRDFKPHNVLRSRDGRVLVTDFGLARGLLVEAEPEPLETTPLPDPSKTPELDATVEVPQRPSAPPQRPSLPPRSQSGSQRENDSVLDAPLTQTGALIGTPAYMAPEQFRGAPPDPRTDQFAFCVTAWQALSGDRPFKGSTIDELRDAVDRGVGSVPAKLPRDVRAVLSRGLDPKPDARYPTLEALLDELDHAARRPQRRRRIALSALSLVAIVAAIVFAVRRDHRATVAVCDAPEDVIAEAWSPALKLELSHRPGVPPESFARVSNAFDQFRERWISSYQAACGMRSAKSSPGRIACLESVRDEASTLSFMLKTAPPQVFDAFDGYATLPFVGRCDRADPDTPPAFPKDQPRRTKVVELLARAGGLRGLPPDTMDGALASLEKEAATIGWEPVLGGLLATAGSAYLGTKRVDRAREVLGRALQVVKRDHNRRLESIVRVNLLEGELIELSTPSAPVPKGISDSHATATLHPVLATAISAARSSMGGDPMLVGVVAMLSSQAYEQLAQWNRYKDAYGEAISYAQEARKQFESVGDTRRAAYSALHEARIYLERGDDRALDDALFVARGATDALEKAGMPAVPELDEVRMRVAFARREYDEVHRLADKYDKPKTDTKMTVTGRVVPAGRVSVIAWKGKLVGDPRRAYTDAENVQLDTAESAPDGTFSIHAEPGWAILAEAPDQRSTPQIVGASPIVLSLAPTTTVSGTAHGKNLLGVHAFALFAVGFNSWQVEVPIERDGTFDLRGLPPGPAKFGAIGEAGNAKRTVRAASPRDVTWPYGQGLDVIVRSDKIGDGKRAWVLAGKLKTSVATRAQLDAAVGDAADVAVSHLVPVGVSNTDAGRGVYRAGDLHAVITGNATGEATVCVSTRSGDDAPVTCKPVTNSPTVTIDYPDGRFAAGMTPIVLEP